MSVYYEWVVEVTATDDAGILDVDHADTYAGALRIASTVDAANYDCPCMPVIALVRNDDKGRSWAYMEDGVLPDEFLDAYQNPAAKVPKRFVTEVAGAKP